MRVTDRGTAVAGLAETDRRSCIFPSICVLDGGRWLLGCRVGPAKSSRTDYSVVAHSDDQGRSWSGLRQPATPLKLGGRAGTWRTVSLTPVGGRRVLAELCWVDFSEPFLPMFNAETEGLVDMRLFVSVSEDGGETWGVPRVVGRGRFDSVPTPATGPALVMPDGRWAVHFEVNKHYHDTTAWQHHSSLTFSADQGATWGDVVDVHTDPQRRIFCWDQRLAVMPDGSVLALFWTFDRKTAKYLNIHARRSTDSGRTWDELWDTGVPGQPARPVGLDDGRIVMAYVDRTAEPVIKARISADGGRTWPDAGELVIQAPKPRSQTWDKKSMQDAWAEMSKFSMGLPDATRLNEREIVVVYYNGPETDQTNIEWARVEV